MSDPAKEMAERLHTGKQRVRQQAGNWMCTCPAHADNNPSLAIRTKGNTLVYRCYAGCQFREIAMQVRAIGYDPTTGERLRDQHGKPVPAREMAPKRETSTDDEEMERRFLRDFEYVPDNDPDWPSNPNAYEAPRSGSVTRRYLYRGYDGRPRMTVTRIEHVDEDGRKHKEMVPISPWRRRKDGRLDFPARTMPPPRVPYGADRAALPGPVFSVEGEKCADALFGLLGGRFAVFSVYGSSPEKADFTGLAGRTVINLSDIDKAGRKYRERLTGMLGPAVIHISSPWRGPAGTRPPEGWDIADEIEGKGGLVTPITPAEFAAHLSRQRRQIVRPDHDAALREAVEAIKRTLAEPGVGSP